MHIQKNIPAIFIYGDKDILVSNQCFKELKKVSKNNCVLHQINGAGHFGTKEGWDTAIVKINEFISNL